MFPHLCRIVSAYPEIQLQVQHAFEMRPELSIPTLCVAENAPRWASNTNKGLPMGETVGGKLALCCSEDSNEHFNVNSF